MNKISKINAREILDSRGNPTIETDVYSDSGAWARAAVPSGASTGTQEALELRDGDPRRFLGKGVLRAVENVNKIIAPVLIGKEISNQNEIDKIMIDLDGTPNKSRLGANAILGVSLAVLKAAAVDAQKPLFQYIGENFGEKKYLMPRPMMNIMNGGVHANSGADLQELMIAPKLNGERNFKESLRMGAEIFQNLKKILAKNNLSTNVGDEGGFAPSFPLNKNGNKAYLDLIMESIVAAGYMPGQDVEIAIDAAASEFFRDGKYILQKDGLKNPTPRGDTSPLGVDQGVLRRQGTGSARSFISAAVHRAHKSMCSVSRPLPLKLTSAEMIAYWEGLIKNYPIYSIEDGLAENDWGNWKLLNEKLASKTKSKIQLVGDDLFVTNPQIIKRGIADKVANAVLIKLNQIGTVSETIEAIKTTQSAGWNAIISHRSGETEDTIISDLAVGLRVGQIKTGSLSRGERIAKYNQLLRIEEQIFSS